MWLLLLQLILTWVYQAKLTYTELHSKLPNLTSKYLKPFYTPSRYPSVEKVEREGGVLVKIFYSGIDPGYVERTYIKNAVLSAARLITTLHLPNDTLLRFRLLHSSLSKPPEDFLPVAALVVVAWKSLHLNTDVYFTPPPSPLSATTLRAAASTITNGESFKHFAESLSKPERCTHPQVETQVINAVRRQEEVRTSESRRTSHVNMSQSGATYVSYSSNSLIHSSCWSQAAESRLRGLMHNPVVPCIVLALSKRACMPTQQPFSRQPVTAYEQTQAIKASNAAAALSPKNYHYSFDQGSSAFPEAYRMLVAEVASASMVDFDSMVAFVREIDEEVKKVATVSS